VVPSASVGLDFATGGNVAIPNCMYSEKSDLEEGKFSFVGAQWESDALIKKPSLEYLME